MNDRSKCFEVEHDVSGLWYTAYSVYVGIKNQGLFVQ